MATPPREPPLFIEIHTGGIEHCSPGLIGSVIAWALLTADGPPPGHTTSARLRSLEESIISFWDNRKNAETHEKATYPKVIEKLASLIVGTPTVETYETVWSYARA